MGQSWHENIGVRDEYAACLRCLKKWKSTSGQSHRGIGLARVMRNLTALRGFWRIRTGRLSLCRNFLQDPYEHKQLPTRPSLFDDDPGLVDWYTGSPDRLTHLSRAEGVLLTMLVPLSK